MEVIGVDDVSFNVRNVNIIEDITFSIGMREFVSIVGPSGCGKSTLLRIIAGLLQPAGGRVLYKGREVMEPTHGISFVFQDFGLLPWLSNVENVMLGMSHFRVSDGTKRKRAAKLLGKFGLEGFENFYPNSLSGGMKQRVGIARAVASNPQVILMDEPFSSLDELTANVLRGDLLKMVKSRRIPINAILMVTHNVEEAILLSDKIIVLSGKPSHVKAINEIKLEQPRDRRSEEFNSVLDSIYAMLTG